MEFDAHGGIIANANAKLVELFDTHDFYYSEDEKQKQTMLKEKITEIETILLTIPEDSSDKVKAEQALIRGKALNSLDAFSADAEAWLSKAVKLDPTNPEAWMHLGTCSWKKADRAQAKVCLMESLNQKETKEALRELSILTRQIRSTAAEGPAKSSDESIKLAKRAIALDMTDAKSWYVLGNAYNTRFFSVSQDLADVKNAMSAYKRSLTLGGDSNPDLFVNRGSIALYMQDYKLARSDFSKAFEIDPSLATAKEQLEELQEYTERVSGVTAACRRCLSGPLGTVGTEGSTMGGKIKRKRLEQVKEALRAHEACVGAKGKRQGPAAIAIDRSGKVPISIKSLAPGDNNDNVLSLKVVLPVSKGSVPPECFVCMDAQGDLCIMAAYNVQGAASPQFGQDCIITVCEPFLRPDSACDTAKENLGTAATATATATATAGEVDLDLPVVQVFRLETLGFDGKIINRSAIQMPGLKIETSDK